MALPDLLTPAIQVAGVLLLGLLTLVTVSGMRARPQPVPVRRDGSRRRP
ncbi:MAG: hypothetical protein JXB05_05755 [Myxococcaceae bacterium]|nr:hypothetical protein [Myxococcaceae bacterium]